MRNCPACKKENAEIAIFCERCKFPFEGTEKEKAVHIGKFISKKGVSYDKDDSLKRSKLILGIIAALNLIFLVLNYRIIDVSGIIFTGLIIVTFSYCALTIEKHSFIKVLIPLLILVLINLLLLLVNPEIFLDGIIIRLVYIAALVYSLIMIRSHNNFKKKYEDED